MNAVIPRTSVTAVISLISGLLCWVAVPFIGAIVAVVCGHVARAEIRREPPGTVDGAGMALAGLILGYVQLVLCVLGFMAIFLFLGGLTFLAALGH